MPKYGQEGSLLGALNNYGALYIHEHCKPELLSRLSQQRLLQTSHAMDNLKCTYDIYSCV